MFEKECSMVRLHQLKIIEERESSRVFTESSIANDLAFFDVEVAEEYRPCQALCIGLWTDDEMDFSVP